MAISTCKTSQPTACPQISIDEHAVIESKPDNTVEDLRLDNPWPELREFARSFDLSSMTAVTHKQLPYGVSSAAARQRRTFANRADDSVRDAALLLIKAAEEWRRGHNDQLPTSKAERSAFKDLISSWDHVGDVALEVRYAFPELFAAGAALNLL